MDNLKAIWQQMEQLTQQLETIATKDQTPQSVFDQLAREEQLRKRYNPLLIVLILLIPVVFFTLLSINFMDGRQALGVFLITASGAAIAWCSQMVKMPLAEFQHDRAAVDFLQVVRTRLDKAKRMLIVGILLQMTLLTLGLLLLMLSEVNQDHFWAYALTLLGFMGGLMGLAIGGSIAFFNRHYADVYQTIDRFKQH